jgi:hypothetical protein
LWPAFLWLFNMPTYHNYVTLEDELIETAKDLYLAFDEASCQYKFTASPEVAESLAFDPVTRGTKFFRVTLKQALEKQAFLFPDEHIRAKPLSSQDVIDTFGFNPSESEPREFGTALLQAMTVEIRTDITVIRDAETPALGKQQALIRLIDWVVNNTSSLDVIREVNGIAPLVALLSASEDMVTKQCATLILAFLAQNATNQRVMIELNGIASLLALLGRDEDLETKRHALAALLNLVANNPANQHAMIVAGGVAPLVGLLTPEEEVEIKRHATIILALFAQTPINHHTIIEAAGFAPFLALLGRDEDLETKRQAIAVLVNLVMNNPENQHAMIEAGGVAPLAALLTPEEEVEIKRHATLILALFAQTPINHHTIIEAAGFAPFLALLGRDEDLETKRHAVAALLNLVVNNPANQHALIEARGVTPLVALLTPEEELETKRYAVGGLTVLGQDTVNQDAIIEAVVPLLALLDQDDDLATKQYVLTALGNLARTFKNRAIINQANGIPILFSFLMSTRALQVRALAGQAFMNLLINTQTQNATFLPLLLCVVLSGALLVTLNDYIAEEYVTKVSEVALNIAAVSLMRIMADMIYGLYIQYNLPLSRPVSTSPHQTLSVFALGDGERNDAEEAFVTEFVPGQG